MNTPEIVLQSLIRKSVCRERSLLKTLLIIACRADLKTAFSHGAQRPFKMQNITKRKNSAQLNDL